MEDIKVAMVLIAGAAEYCGGLTKAARFQLLAQAQAQAQFEKCLLNGM
jgi:hypothetical protein